MNNDLISRSALLEELSSLTITITGLREGKGVLRNCLTEYRKTFLRIVDEAAAVDAVVLPCKVGDTVYWLDYNRAACGNCDCYSSFYGMDSICDKRYELYPEIDPVDDDEHCPKHFVEIIEWKTTMNWIFNHLNDFGKTVFLTREEAEAALKRRVDE